MSLQQYNRQVHASELTGVKDGEYIAKVIRSELAPVNQGFDHGEKLVITWEIAEGECAKKTVQQHINVGIKNIKNADQRKSIAQEQYDKLRLATLGKDDKGFILCAMHESDFLERQARIVLKTSEQEGKSYKNIYPKAIEEGSAPTHMVAPQAHVQPTHNQAPAYVAPVQQPVQPVPIQPTYVPPVQQAPVYTPPAPQQPMQPAYVPPVQQQQYQQPVQPVIDDEIPF